jgi:SAM-dependent methyltransferase
MPFSYVASEADPPFDFIDPPFAFNAPNIARYPAEVSGYHILRCMAARLGWPSLTQKRILDFGCGVRLARTIVNLGLDIGLYAGVDVNPFSIDWLRSNIKDPRFIFEHIDDYNHEYNPDGNPDEDYASLKHLSALDFDVACMFSVITHQGPAEAKRLFSGLRALVHGNGQLYFTAFLSREITDFKGGVYHPDYLAELLRQSGWHTDRIYDRTQLQQFAFVCQCV